MLLRVPLIKIFVTIILFIAFLPAAGLFSQDDFDFGSETGSETSVGDTGEKSRFRFPLRGSINAETARQTGDPRWIRLGPSANLIFDASSQAGLFYSEVTARYNSAYGIEEDSQETIDGYELEAVLRELYWKKSFGIFTVTLGKVMTVWTKADILPVTDVVSPTDMTQAFFANPGENRLGQNMARIDFYFDNSDLSFVASPWPEFDRITDGDHPYSFLGLGGNSSMSGGSGGDTPIRLKEKDTKYDPEGGVRYNRIMGKSEAAVMAGWFHVRQPIIDLEMTSGGIDIYKVYQPYLFMGGSLTYAMDPVLFKLEGGYGKDKPVQRIIESQFCVSGGSCIDVQLPAGFMKVDQIAVSAGVDINLGSYGTIIGEGSLQQNQSNDPEIYPDRDMVSVGAGYSNTFLKETLSFSIFGFFLEDYRNILYRAQATYKATDNFSVFIQYTQIEIGSYQTDYSAMADFDRGDLMFQYHFDLSVR